MHGQYNYGIQQSYGPQNFPLTPNVAQGAQTRQDPTSANKGKDINVITKPSLQKPPPLPCTSTCVQPAPPDKSEQPIHK